MLRTLIAQTNEIDESDVAMINIMAQLDMDNNLMSNSIGFLFGDMALLNDDFLPALSQRLPFEVIGLNSNLTAGTGLKEDYSLLTLMVLTSDEVNIATGLSEDFSVRPEKSVEDLHREVAARLGRPPKLIILLCSRQSFNFHPSRIVKRLKAIVGDCPIFGTLACDLDSMPDNGFMAYNGVKHMDRLAMVMLDGPIAPKFSLYRIQANKFLKRKAIITSSDGNIIKKINGLWAVDYLSSIGFKVEHNDYFTFNVPLVVENPETGFWEPHLIVSVVGSKWVACTHDVDENSTLGLAAMDDSDVIKTAGDLADELKWENFNFCLINSCMGRQISLGLDYLGEIERLRASLSSGMPFALTYSGGEICPIRGTSHGQINAFHTLALTCCRF
jgi:hypothetical protein